MITDFPPLFSAIYLARGNHESKSMNKIYGFEGEVRSKLSETFVELFSEVFCCLPLAHVINGRVFVVHGGLFSVDGVKLSDIKSIDRFCEPPEEGNLQRANFPTFPLESWYCSYNHCCVIVPQA